MKSLPTLAISCLLLVPAVLHGQQISPNPNPAGNTITVDTQDYFNWQKSDNPFTNNGVIRHYEQWQVKEPDKCLIGWRCFHV